MDGQHATAAGTAARDVVAGDTVGRRVGVADRRVFHPGTLRRARTGRNPHTLEFAVVDVETTGLDPAEGARVCEIAVVRVRGDGTVLAEFSTLVDPRCPVVGTEFHGIGDADVLGAPTSAAIVGELAELFSGAVVVGHKLDFEERFLAAEFVPAGLPARLPGLCTLQTLRAQVDLERYSLPRATYALSGRWPSGQHTALGDARATARLLVELLHNAPAPLSYTGPEPVRGVPVAEAGAVRLKSRIPTATLWSAVGVEPCLTRPIARWPARWRPLELDHEMCGGRFTAEERAAAIQAARVRQRRHELLTAAAGVTAGLASAAAMATLTRQARAILWR